MRYACLLALLFAGCGKKAEPTQPVSANFNAPVKVEQRAPAAPVDADWTHRELAEHINKKKVAAILREAGLVLMAGNRPVALFSEDDKTKAAVIVFLCPDAKGAREMAATMGSDGFAYGRFAIGARDSERADDIGYLKRIREVLTPR